MMVIVLGTGRCGTVSVSHLLNEQDGVTCTHEHYLLPWKANERKLEKALGHIQSQDTYTKGDAGFYYLPYCELIYQRIWDVRFVCLKREKDKVIDSFVSTRRDLFVNDKKKWSRCMPTYGKMSIAKAVSRYYDEYYERAEKLTKTLSLKVFDMESVLNSHIGQMDLFAFLGLENPKLMVGLCLNRRQ